MMDTKNKTKRYHFSSSVQSGYVYSKEKDELPILTLIFIITNTNIMWSANKCQKILMAVPTYTLKSNFLKQIHLWKDQEKVAQLEVWCPVEWFSQASTEFVHFHRQSSFQLWTVIIQLQLLKGVIHLKSYSNNLTCDHFLNNKTRVFVCHMNCKISSTFIGIYIHFQVW